VLELTVRLIASLAVVVGLMLLLARLVGKRYGARTGAPVQVLHRQPLSRSASVAVITVGSRVLVVGSTDHQVSLLTELDPEELADAELEAALDAGFDSGLDVEPEPELTAELPLDLPARPAAAAAVPARTGIAALTTMSSLASLTQRKPRPGTSPRRTAAPKGASTAATDGALAGSVLSTQTWRQAFAAATGKTS
jgi:flagellar protein FliO/FliZ